MSITGSGKSTFIQAATGNKGAVIGTTLTSGKRAPFSFLISNKSATLILCKETPGIKEFPLSNYPNVKLVDTPGSMTPN